MTEEQKTKRREANRKWRLANPDKAKAANLKWRAAHPDKVKEMTKRWRLNLKVQALSQVQAPATVPETQNA